MMIDSLLHVTANMYHAFMAWLDTVTWFQGVVCVFIFQASRGIDILSGQIQKLHNRVERIDIKNNGDYKE